MSEPTEITSAQLRDLDPGHHIHISVGPETPKRILFIGATHNYFKVGHTTINYLAAHFPWIQIRLAIPDIKNAVAACRGKNVELVEWEPENPRSLFPVFEGCHAVLLVPPINNRVEVTALYLEAAKRAKLEFMVCIGIQHENPSLRLAADANAVLKMLQESGIAYCHLNLPVFLENLLYQKDSILSTGQFSYPCSPGATFSYVACKDLAPAVANMLVNSTIYPDTKWTAKSQTSCRELQAAFSAVLGKPIKFVRIADQDFIDTIINDTGCASSPHAARGVLELWKEIEEGRDLVASDTFAEILGRAPMTALEWIEEHKCCFSGQPCDHPQPPKKTALTIN